MKSLRTFFIIISLLTITACDQSKDNDSYGKDVTQQFISEYNGQYREATSRSDGGEILTISRDGEIEVQKIRNVGRVNNPAIPEGTICNYILRGQIRNVVELNDQFRQRSDEEGKIYFIPQTHNMTFSVLQVSLSNDLRAGTTEDPSCLNFQEEMNQKLPMYTYGMELFPGGHIRLHTTNNDDLTASERGPGTLDENYTRQ